MARLLTTGYETGDLAESGASVVASAHTLTVVGSTPTPRAGSYCLKIAPIAANFLGATSKGFSFGGNKTDVWLRFAFFIHGFGINNDCQIVQWLDSASGAQANLNYNPADGLLRVYRGGTNLGTLLGAASVSFAQDGWHVIEMRYQITSTTVGTLEVWVDSTQVINSSGDNSNTTNVNVASLLVGALATSSSSTGMAGVYIAFDDIAINDTTGTRNNGRPGDGRVVLLTPSGAGSSTVLTRGGTDSGANWSQVDELPPSMTDYVTSVNPGDCDLYAMTNVIGTPLGINVVEELVLARKSDTGAASVGPTIKSGVTISEATAVALPFPTETYVTARWETDPNTSAAWTLSAVNAVEAGATVR